MPNKELVGNVIRFFHSVANSVGVAYLLKRDADRGPSLTELAENTRRLKREANRAEEAQAAVVASLLESKLVRDSIRSLFALDDDVEDERQQQVLDEAAMIAAEKDKQQQALRGLIEQVLIGREKPVQPPKNGEKHA